ncbi:MAG TPA: transporter substrate-binding domain-containing protein, partial [Salinimicrobium catena]|nr:transporter substrate-binding domain-containing protein [Salinimicrobium catena]
MKNSDLYRLYYFLLFLFAFFGHSFILNAQEKDESETLRVGVYNNPPKIFINEKGEADGIFIDLLEVIAEKEDLQLRFVTGEWNELKQQLTEDEIDLLPDVAYSRKRDSLYVLNSIPVLSSWLDAYTLKDTELESLSDLQNKKVGVLKGSVQEEFFEEFAKKNLKLQYSTLTYDDYQASVEALYNKDIDVLIASRFFYFTKHVNGKITSSGIIF